MCCGLERWTHHEAHLLHDWESELVNILLELLPGFRNTLLSHSRVCFCTPPFGVDCREMGTGPCMTVLADVETARVDRGPVPCEWWRERDLLFFYVMDIF